MTQAPSTKSRNWTSEDVLRALKRASEKARQLAEQTGTPFVVRERRLDMNTQSTSKDEQDIPEYTREQLGVGVRGKHYKQFTQGCNVVVSHSKDPDLKKALQALMRAAEKARQLSEQTGTPFVVRKSTTAGKQSK